jgi:hypothetical protein
MNWWQELDIAALRSLFPPGSKVEHRWHKETIATIDNYIARPWPDSVTYSSHEYGVLVTPIRNLFSIYRPLFNFTVDPELLNLYEFCSGVH